MLTAPFNFVPLNEKVFFPPWADRISHDIPFSDGESGEIDITITAKSPIFIRDSKDKEKFCNFNGEYYIPASSVKGMVRNVLEIMSFSKLSQELFTDKTYAVRDLSESKNFYMKQMNQMEHTTYCGWLKKDSDGYIIEDCGVPGRIHHKQIDYALELDFASKFKIDNLDSKQKTAEYKYSLVGDKIHTIKVGDKYYSEKNSKYDKREFYKYDKNCKNIASLVLTGQPTPRKDNGKKGDGKGFEFLFFDKQGELKIEDKVFENFKSAYFDARDTEPKESPDWKYWKEKLYNGDKIPVFFQKNGKKVLHFGLSYLYKLPYKHSVKDGIYDIYLDDRLSLVQTIFGYISKSDKSALKGRVNFSHFKAIKNIKVLDPRTEILGTPRASYYPIYIKQQNGKLYTTMMDNNFKIAGRKRYPIHKGSTVKKTEKTGNEKVGTTLVPLKEGVVFKGKLRYHNLKKAEIGAILSALTFHNTPNTYHNIGLAKSLGYGKISIKIDGIDNIQNYLKEFELYITEQILDWKDSVQLKELITMATEQNNSGNSKLEYMKLEQFAKNKTGNDKDYLRNYSNLNNIEVRTIKSLVSNEDLEELERKNQVYLKQQKIYKQEQKKKQEHDNDWELVQVTQNIDVVKSFISKYPNSEFLEEAQNRIKIIEEELQKQKIQELNKGAIKKWEVISSIESKYKKRALKDYIDKYPDSPKATEAKKMLESLEKKGSLKEDSLSALSSKKDFKSFRNIINEYKKSNTLSDKDKDTIKTALKIFYNEATKKNRKKFLNEMKLSSLIGLDFEDMIKKELNL